MSKLIPNASVVKIPASAEALVPLHVKRLAAVKEAAAQRRRTGNSPLNYSSLSETAFRKELGL